MEQPDHLGNWNRITNEETTHSLVGSMYFALLLRVPEIDAFVTWLLAGTAATAALVVANIQAVTETLGRGGVQWALYSLTSSLLFGIAAKLSTLFIPSNAAHIGASRERIGSILKVHREEREKIKAVAVAGNASMPPDIQINDVLEQFARPMPWWVKLVFFRNMKKQIDGKERHGDLLLAVRGWLWQSGLCFLQAGAVLMALISVAVHVLDP